MDFIWMKNCFQNELLKKEVFVQKRIKRVIVSEMGF